MMNSKLFNDCTVLVLDDQTTSRSILTHVIKSINPKITVVEKTNPESALEWATENVADLVLADYVMPEMNGIEFVKLLKTLPKYRQVPVMMITMIKDSDTRYAALDAGISDFLSKPIDVHECSSRSRNLLTMRVQQQTLETKSDLLESLVRAATAEVRIRERETLMRLARAGEHKDFDTAQHLQRMALYSRALAEAFGLSPDEAETVELAAPLHDIGKIGIADSVLLKKGPLDDDELAVMRKHPLIGYEILQDSPSKFLQMGAEIALAHHERYDGTGYPYQISGKKIPLSARIVAIADVFDALTSKRPYKEAWTIDAAFEYLKTESGKHFDPDLVSAMISIRPKLETIHASHKETSH